MRPTEIQAIGTELAIRWDDGSESFLPLRTLREHCPCAGCQGEGDILGRVHRVAQDKLTPAAYVLRSIGWVGGYAIQPVWSDGHATGLFSFDYLRRLTPPTS